MIKFNKKKFGVYISVWNVISHPLPHLFRNWYFIAQKNSVISRTVADDKIAETTV